MTTMKTITTIIILIFVLFLIQAIFFSKSGLAQGALREFNEVVQTTLGIADSASSVVNRDISESFRDMYANLQQAMQSSSTECLVETGFPLIWDKASFTFTQESDGVLVSYVVGKKSLPMISDKIEGMKLCSVTRDNAAGSFDNLYIDNEDSAGLPYNEFDSISVHSDGYTIDGIDAKHGARYFFKYDKDHICMIPQRKGGIPISTNYAGLSPKEVDAVDDRRTSLEVCN